MWSLKGAGTDSHINLIKLFCIPRNQNQFKLNHHKAKQNSLFVNVYKNFTKLTSHAITNTVQISCCPKYLKPLSYQVSNIFKYKYVLFLENHSNTSGQSELGLLEASLDQDNEIYVRHIQQNCTTEKHFIFGPRFHHVGIFFITFLLNWRKTQWKHITAIQSIYLCTQLQ